MVWDVGFTCKDCTCCLKKRKEKKKDKPTWRPESGLWENNKLFLKLRNKGRWIRVLAQAVGTARRTIWNILKKNEASGVPDVEQVGQGRQQQLRTETLREQCTKRQKTTVSDITNSFDRAGVKDQKSIV